MAKDKKTSIRVQGTAITILSRKAEDYISLTDMVKHFDGGGALIEQWLKSKDTVLFLGVWEQINNPEFNSLEFEGIKNEAGRNSFFLSAKKWIELTGAKGLVASAGRYGGTYAHRDIAFEFGSWLSPEFKLYLIKEFQRLKEDENRRLSLGWNLNRTLASSFDRVHPFDQRHDTRDQFTIDERHLCERDFRSSLKLGRQMALAKQSLGTFFAQCDLRGPFAIHAEHKPVAEVSAELHRHNVYVGALGCEHKRYSRGAGFNAQSANYIRYRLGVFWRHHPLRELIMNGPQQR